MPLNLGRSLVHRIKVFIKLTFHFLLVKKIVFLGQEIKSKKLEMFLTECPRDAMQGWGEFIPTQKKIDYINALMEVGFDVLDCGSFVSPKAIPQMADTKDVSQKFRKKITPKFLSSLPIFLALNEP
jgi:hypothetical protein